MQIAIIGAGMVGKALAAAWTRTGHDIVLGLRDPAKGGEYAATGPREAAESADAVVIAVPYGAVPDVAAALGPVTGRIVIDATNPLIYSDGARELAVGFDTSAGEQLQALLPQARVVKTLNQVGSGVMEDASGFVHPPVMFMAGNDDAAKETVAGLLTDLGFEPIDAGALDRARLLEPMAMVWINQTLMRGRGPNWAFAALPRQPKDG